VTLPKIRFLKNERILEVAQGANLMSALLGAGIPVASSCDGEGVCAKCRMQVLAGHENLSRPSELEEFLMERYELKAGVRISCQCEVQGDVKIHATYW
jgi:2Fe-2S ferredoxin